MEEQRGLPPGSLEEDEAARLLALQNITVGGPAGRNAGADDNDGIETYEDFSDDSFDKGGFGSDDDY